MFLIYNSPVIIKALLLSFFSFFSSLDERCSCLKLLKSCNPKQWDKQVTEPYEGGNRAAGSFNLPKNKNVTNIENEN